MSLTCGGVSLFDLFGRVRVDKVVQSDAGGGNVVHCSPGKVAGVGKLYGGPGANGGLPGGHAGAGLPSELLPLDVVQHGLKRKEMMDLYKGMKGGI